MMISDDDTGGGEYHQRADYDDVDPNRSTGTVLEAAFVDPAYQWPPPDGQGKNAIELKASQALMADLDDPTKEFDKETQRFFTKKPGASSSGVRPGQKGIKHSKTVLEDHSYRGFLCCKWNVKNQVAEIHREDPFEVDQNGRIIPMPPGTPPQEQANSAASPAKSDKQMRKESRYGKVPEGILIYRLNTTTRRLELLSQPHTNTNTKALVRDMIIASASPSNDKSRRGMDLVGTDGTRTTLVACEQRTAIAWLEVLDMMFGKGHSNVCCVVQYRYFLVYGLVCVCSHSPFPCTCRALMAIHSPVASRKKERR
jgi:hypothetical protein